MRSARGTSEAVQRTQVKRRLSTGVYAQARLGSISQQCHKALRGAQNGSCVQSSPIPVFRVRSIYVRPRLESPSNAHRVHCLHRCKEALCGFSNLWNWLRGVNGQRWSSFRGASGRPYQDPCKHHTLLSYK
ncbi:uncharacterized protein Tco025E_04079 [Trypanosoma conorhini]|uniref:Uncharacterized protein n=1 Tax=Trypanosoma conorhini TaxID=83891 RepID=A0A3R7PGM1_9TRYP|nr:uncharacterized protein Tco025E_04079 [Trypanosoma conorhini]RNF19571.1 hypothetical protein Tco025E_04079 [Trypanosoma conorhini]